MEAKVLSEAKVYVGTYAKYNNGSLSGAWLDLSDYSDKEEFYEACRELHKDEEDAEYMFQDWENVPEGLIGESWISENFFALRDAVEDLSDTEQEAFFVWCNYKSHDLGEEDADDLVRDFRDEYLGQYDDEEDFAYEIIEECYDLPEFAKTYFAYFQERADLVAIYPHIFFTLLCRFYMIENVIGNGGNLFIQFLIGVGFECYYFHIANLLICRKIRDMVRIKSHSSYRHGRNFFCCFRTNFIRFCEEKGFFLGRF